jgi:tRNA-2-methylthio-N6-dimethylallyladenosine synthase
MKSIHVSGSESSVSFETFVKRNVNVPTDSRHRRFVSDAGSVGAILLYLSRYTDTVSKTFYIETFGCQMNAHDSEKVIGTLEQEGYSRVQDEADAGLILYNTCSIRDKAEQKVFHRLNEYKKLQGEGKKFAVLGCVAQQEGEKIFDKAPYVSLVSGSASYRNLPQMLARLEAGEQRITGLDDRQTDETFETPFVARTNPHRGYITIIEGCDKFCAYCVVPYTRGKERSRTANSVLDEAIRMADAGFTEIQLLGQNVNSYHDPSAKMTFAELLAAVGSIPGIRRVRFTTSHPRDFTKDIVDAIDAVPTLCDHVHLPVQSGSTNVLRAMAREYTRDWYLERISWIKAAKRDISITSDIIVGFPGETEEDLEQTATLLEEVGYDAIFAFKYSPRPNTPAITMADSISEEVKVKRLQILLDRQRETQRLNYERHLGETMELMVEGHNRQRNQVIGRSTQNKTVNFTTNQPILPATGSFVSVRITQTFPNSLLGEALAS